MPITIDGGGSITGLTTTGISAVQNLPTTGTITNLTTTTISDGTNSTSSTNCIQGSAKAWVNYNGSTQVIRASYNTSSITKNGTGDYTINFTNAFVDANYAITTSAGKGSTGSDPRYAGTSGANPTTTACRITVKYNDTTTSALQDVEYVSVSIFR